MLIEWQSLQPLPRLDRHSELLDVGRLEEGGVKRERTNKSSSSLGTSSNVGAEDWEDSIVYNPQV